VRAGRYLLAIGAALLMTSGAGAQELTGTLKRVKETGSLIIGYRESSIPFSYVTKSGVPIGYSIDLCKEVVDDVAAELGTEVTVTYKKVTSDTRISALLAGEIDLECGSTTANFERKKQVAFSPIFFVSGTKLMVKRSSGIASYRNLRGKTVVVTAGTTNEAAVKAISEKQQLGVNFVVGNDHAESFAILTAGKADAFATDDVLLYGLLATSKEGSQYEVVGEFLSYDPYGLMFRKGDPDLAAIVDRTFTRLAESREIMQLYDKWFLARLPTGETLDLPMGPQLQEILRVLGFPD
jgi:glutamate/aspartate transport system substrate-binding protein